MSVQRAVSDREEALRQQLLTTKQTPHHPVVLVCCCDRCALNTAVRGVEGNFGESKHERARPTVCPPSLSSLFISLPRPKSKQRAGAALTDGSCCERPRSQQKEADGVKSRSTRAALSEPQ